MGELKHDEERLVVARGGEGGTGNASVKGGRGTTGKASPPEKGQRGWMDIELKLVRGEGREGGREGGGRQADRGGREQPPCLHPCHGNNF